MLYLINLVFAVFLILPHTSYANFEFSPISAQLMTTGTSSSLIAKITNHDASDIPIVIRIFERGASDDGQETRTPSTDVEVYPSQFILGPNEQKLIKVVWKGPKELPFEKAYRILVEHVPVELTPQKLGQGAIKIMINYSGMIYVWSKPERSDVQLIALRKSKKSDRKYLVTLRNDGTSHSIIAKPEIDLTCVSKKSSTAPLKLTLNASALKNIDGRNLLANSSLETNINVPTNFSECEEVTWSFRYATE